MIEPTVKIPNPHNGGTCPASSDGGIGFYSVVPLGNGVSEVACPGGCGWWRDFDEATGAIVNGDHIDAMFPSRADRDSPISEASS